MFFSSIEKPVEIVFNDTDSFESTENVSPQLAHLISTELIVNLDIDFHFNKFTSVFFSYDIFFLVYPVFL